MHEVNEQGREVAPFQIKEAQFVISAVGPSQYPEHDWPEVALVGRSNVGKSSLINKLCNRRNLAKTSAKPGKTQTINFYQINKAFHLVDLPGYGYARVSKELKSGWGRMMENYLKNRPQLRAVIQLIDIRHPPTNNDIDMNRWLAHFQIATAVIATKADKIPRGQYAKQIKVIRQALEIPTDIPIIVFSAETGVGKEDLLDLLAYLWNVELDSEDNPPTP